MTKGLTTNYLICKTYKLKAGETILFHAAAGGVGQIFAQWANSIGAKIIGTVGSDEKIKIAEDKWLPVNVINYTIKTILQKKYWRLPTMRACRPYFDGSWKKYFSMVR